MLNSRNSKLFIQQQGVVLVVALLMLLVITIVGVTGLQTTVLQETMAGAVRDKHIAFNAAEAALRDGEKYLNETAILPGFDDTNGRYSSDYTAEELWKTLSWAGATQSACNCFIYDDGGLIASSGVTLPRYIIEELPESEMEPPSVVVHPGPPETRQLYQVTARGVGNVGGVAILQTTFLR
jgi:type IV pilus assembly protein PilX